MFPSLAAAAECAQIEPLEERLLLSPEVANRVAADASRRRH